MKFIKDKRSKALRITVLINNLSRNVIALVIIGHSGIYHRTRRVCPPRRSIRISLSGLYILHFSAIPDKYTTEDMESDEAIDCLVIKLIRDEILPNSKETPKEFIASQMVLLNKGSIHSTYSINTDNDCGKLREHFAKICFETLLQFSLLTPNEIFTSADPNASALAVTSLLHRFKSVLIKYTDDVKLTG